MNKQPITIDLLIGSFIYNANDSRESLKEAVRDGDNIIATDAHSLIVCPKKYSSTPDAYRSISDTQFPDYRKVVPDFPEAFIGKISTAILLDECLMLPSENIYEECEECEGAGCLYTINSNRRECPNDCDDGKTELIGKIIPSFSHVDLTESKLFAFRINETLFDPNLMERMALVAKAFNCDIDVKRLEQTSACVFFVNDIMILVMPLQKGGGIAEDPGRYEIIDIRFSVTGKPAGI